MFQDCCFGHRLLNLPIVHFFSFSTLWICPLGGNVSGTQVLFCMLVLWFMICSVDLWRLLQNWSQIKSFSSHRVQLWDIIFTKMCGLYNPHKICLTSLFSWLCLSATRCRWLKLSLLHNPCEDCILLPVVILSSWLNFYLSDQYAFNNLIFSQQQRKHLSFIDLHIYLSRKVLMMKNQLKQNWVYI